MRRLPALLLLATLAPLAPGAAQEAGLLDCEACHTAGSADPSARLETSRYPDIAGHPARYIARQLRAYREGRREHVQMTRTAIALGEGAPAAARRYAAAPAARTHRAEGEETAGHDEAAPDLVTEGDWSRGIAPCASCHAGPNRARLAPPLHGQPEEYLAGQLHAFAEGRRRSDPMGRMRAYAARLDEGEISRLAAWYAADRADGKGSQP